MVQSFVPFLEITVSEPYETRESALGEKQYTLQINLEITNRSVITAHEVHVDVEVPLEGLIFPVLKPKSIDRDGRTIKIGYTPAFNLHSQDTYKQFYLLSLSVRVATESHSHREATISLVTQKRSFLRRIKQRSTHLAAVHSWFFDC